MNKINFFLKLSSIILFSTIISCSSHENEEGDFFGEKMDYRILEVTNSLQFKNNPMIKGKEVNYKDSKILYLDDDLSKPFASICITVKGKMVGIVEAIKISDKVLSENKAPDNQKYVLIYTDFTNFDMNLKTGRFSVYDLNYDEFKVLSVNLKRGVIESIKTHKMPKNVQKKYGIKLNNSLQDGVNFLAKLPSSCYGGSDNNVSWFECLDCMDTVCQSDPECALTFFAVNSVSNGSGYVSMGIACAYIAATR